MYDGEWHDWPYTYFRSVADGQECRRQREMEWRRNKDPEEIERGRAAAKEKAAKAMEDSEDVNRELLLRRVWWLVQP